MKISTLPLPTRLSLAVTAVLIATTVAADVMAVRELRAALAKSVSGSLSGMVERMGGQIDQDLVILRGLLESEAELLAGREAAEMREFVVRQGATLNFAFDYGVLIVDAGGGVVADSRDRDQWEGVSLAGEEFFQRSFALRRAIISQPFAVPAPDARPVVMFTAPLRDANGKMTGILAGGLDLEKNRILGLPTGIRTSRYGQIGVFTLDGTVVAHTDKRLILEQYENPLAEAGGDGSGFRTVEVKGPDGEKALLAVSRLKEADWIIAGIFPSDEVYAPIESGFAGAHYWFAGGLAACCVLVWLVAGGTVRDLNRLAGSVAALQGDDGAETSRRVGGDFRGEAGMLAGAVNAMLDNLERAGRDNAELSARLAGAEERERRSIAADLHDSVCQTLALANMRLGGLKKKFGGKPEDAAAIAGVQALVEQSVAEMKSLIFNLSPGILYELGLEAALEWYAGVFTERYGIRAVFSAPEPLGKIDENLAIFLYRAAGELLANAAKHSGGDRVDVAVYREGDMLILAVEDNGRGFSPGNGGKAGFGLGNIRGQARGAGGRLEVSARAGGGTVARLSVPVRGDG